MGQQEIQALLVKQVQQVLQVLLALLVMELLVILGIEAILGPPVMMEQ